MFWKYLTFLVNYFSPTGNKNWTFLLMQFSGRPHNVCMRDNLKFFLSRSRLKWMLAILMEWWLSPRWSFVVWDTSSEVPARWHTWVCAIYDRWTGWHSQNKLDRWTGFSDCPPWLSSPFDPNRAKNVKNGADISPFSRLSLKLAFYFTKFLGSSKFLNRI